MAVLEGSESDLMQLWGLITQLGEQLSQNQSKSVSLYSLTGKMKVWFIPSTNVQLVQSVLGAGHQRENGFRSSSVRHSQVRALCLKQDVIAVGSTRIRQKVLYPTFSCAEWLTVVRRGIRNGIGTHERHDDDGKPGSTTR